MSDAPKFDTAALLARLAERDMTAVEHVHDQLLATTDPKVVSDLGRTYQRVARSLRQTLALRAKLEREAAQDAAARPAPKPTLDIVGFRIDERVEAIHDAVVRVAEAAHPGDPHSVAEAMDRFEVETADWTDDPCYLDDDLDDQVIQACELIGLPQALAETWRDLPEPSWDYARLDMDDDEDDEDPSPDVPAPDLRHDSG